MRNFKFNLRKLGLTIVSLAALILAGFSVNTASAAAIGGGVAVQSSVSGSNVGLVINVHHKKKKWRRRGRIHFYFGGPHFGVHYGRYHRYRRYCRRWKKRCAYRHGWKTYRWYRCMRYYGCR